MYKKQFIYIYKDYTGIFLEGKEGWFIDYFTKQKNHKNNV